MSDTAEVDSFGFFSMTAPPTRPRHKVRNLRGLNHHAVDAFGKWKERAAEHQPEMKVDVAVCMTGYEEVGVTAMTIFNLSLLLNFYCSCSAQADTSANCQCSAT